MAGINQMGNGAVARRCYRPLKLMRVSSVPHCRSHRALQSPVETAELPVTAPVREATAPMPARPPALAESAHPLRRAAQLGVMLAAAWLAGAHLH
jgi:hypothetical protein